MHIDLPTGMGNVHRPSDNQEEEHQYLDTLQTLTTVFWAHTESSAFHSASMSGQVSPSFLWGPVSQNVQGE